MLRILCDSTELVAILGAEAPDTVVIGGYALRDSDLSGLTSRVREIKRDEFGDPNVPMKWNVRDLDRALTLHNLMHLKQLLLDRSDSVRSRLLGALVAADAVLFLSILLAHSKKRQVLGKTREDLIRYSFSNFLMRAGLHWANEGAPVEAEIILDWPESRRRHVFVNEYHSGWKSGESLTDCQKITYRCGALCNLRFRPSLLFGVTDLDERLQLADLVVGAGRSFVSFCMDKVPETDFGVRQFVALAPRLEREDGWKCWGRGLTVSPANSPFSEAILAGFNKLRC